MIVFFKQRTAYELRISSCSADVCSSDLPPAPDQRLHWIAGGQAKGDGLAACRPWFGHVRRAYLIGEAMESFAAAIGDACPVEKSGDLATAGKAAAAAAEPGDPVLLSPARPSFETGEASCRGRGCTVGWNRGGGLSEK